MKKIKSFTGKEDTLKQNQKVMMQHWKKTVKEHPLEMSDILKTRYYLKKI